MKKAEWIWIDNYKRDVHAEFVCSFDYDKNGSELSLEVSCDGNYAVFLNGEFVGLGQMSDFENYKLRDLYNLKGVAVQGKNLIKILVWHIGENSVNYHAETAGLWFEVRSGKKVIACSEKDTLSRVQSSYAQEYCRLIAQVGITSLYDFTAADAEFKESVISPKKVEFAKENVKNLKLLPEVYGKVIKKESNRVLVDLGREYYGLLRFTLQSSTEGNKFTVYFGEHILPEGTLLRDISVCHFGLDFIAKKGENSFSDYLRPIGCRYLELVSQDKVDEVRLGVAPMEYAFNHANTGLALSDPLDKQIYETCVRTLKCCANKHYIDCPWREQGMYVLDSKNQMLCGYYAFKEFALPRFNLIFLSKGMTEYGLLSSCPPSAQDNFIIPFFSLVYILQVYEYVAYSGDESIIPQVEGALSEIMRTFTRKIDENGLIPRFSYEHFWNFYEWTAGSDGWPCDKQASEERKDGQTYDLILNCAYLMATEKYVLMLKKLGKDYSFPIDDFRARLKQTFYDIEKGLFRLNSRTDSYSRLGCSIALLADLVGGVEAERVAKNLVDGRGVIDCSLSCANFFYDALLKVDGNYKDYVLQDIRKKYKYMLDNGATTFWETLNGSAENGGIGSLCHGWSALPIYYYHKFFAEEQGER